MNLVLILNGEVILILSLLQFTPDVYRDTEQILLIRISPDTQEVVRVLIKGCIVFSGLT